MILLLSWGGAVIGPRSRETKDRVIQDYLRRDLVVWSSSLSAAAKVRAHNSWAVGVLRYTMPLVGWFRRELQQLVDLGPPNQMWGTLPKRLKRSAIPAPWQRW